MSCPAESRTLEEYKSMNTNYMNGQSSLKKKLKEIGIKIYEASEISKNGGKKEYNIKFDLENIINSSLRESSPSDSAWGDCRCECQNVNVSVYRTSHYPRDVVIRTCTCDTVNCSNHSYCRCEDQEMTCYVGCNGD
jgi:hypothetical protein